MRPAIVTIVTTQSWEPRLAQQIRSSGLVRLMQRCSTYEQALRASADAVVIGSESGLATPAVIQAWKANGMVVVGIAEPSDPTATARLADADAVFRSDDPRVLGFLATTSAAEPVAPVMSIWVTGPRGAPGRSEVSLALARSLAAAHEGADLVDLDLDAPCLGLRLGVSPFARPGTARVGSVRLTGFPPAHGPLGDTLRARMIAGLSGPVVIDAGPSGRPSGRPVIVAAAHDTGLVRLRRFLKYWTGPEPLLVLNRCQDPRSDTAVAAAACGIQAAAAIPELDPPTGPEPLAGMVDALAGVLTRLIPPSRQLSA